MKSGDGWVLFRYWPGDTKVV